MQLVGPGNGKSVYPMGRLIPKSRFTGNAGLIEMARSFGANERQTLAQDRHSGAFGFITACWRRTRNIAQT
jgi:hypothetical protein